MRPLKVVKGCVEMAVLNGGNIQLNYTNISYSVETGGRNSIHPKIEFYVVIVQICINVYVVLVGLNID